MSKAFDVLIFWYKFILKYVTFNFMIVVKIKARLLRWQVECIGGQVSATFLERGALF